MPNSPIAKISRPLLRGLFRRERLHLLLDACQGHPVTWISAPAGSGKTSLIGSYLEARELPSLWYHLDEGDGDLAAFFYYLGMGAKAMAPRRRKSLPLFTPEYLLGVPVFTRRYFEQLFRSIPARCALVFDCFQDVPDQTGFHEMMVHALDVVPEGGRIFVMSRHAPPPELVRHQANGKIRLVTWNEIRFTSEESRLLLSAAGHPCLPEETMEELHRMTGGWAAGLVLLMAQSRPAEADRSEPLPLNPQGIFDFFATEIFNRSRPVVQSVLLRTAFLPRVDAVLAERLTGTGEARSVLETLSRDHYFTQRHEQVYRYHPLFREFLLARARREFPPEEIRFLCLDAARFLEQAGEYGEAVELYREAAAWEELSRLAVTQAPVLVGQGRWLTLRGWLCGIPEPFFDASPWLSFWLGVARLPFQPGQSLEEFERAYAGFSRDGDRAGMIASCCSAVDSIVHGWDDFTVLDHWIPRLEEPLATAAVRLPPELRARAALCLASAQLIRQPHRTDLAVTLDEAVALVKGCGDDNLKFQAHMVALNYYCWLGEVEKGTFVASQSARLANSPVVSPLLRLTWIWIEALLTMSLTADAAGGLTKVSVALQMAHDTGVRALDPILAGLGANAALLLGDREQARAFLDQLDRLLGRNLRHGYALYHYSTAWYHVLGGEPDLALGQIGTALRVARETGYVLPEMLIRLAQARILHLCGQLDEAVARLAQLEAPLERIGSHLLKMHWLLDSADLALTRGEEREAVLKLKEGMALGRKHGFASMFWWWDPTVMSRLCAVALDAGIETGYVERMIRKHRLHPPAAPVSCDSWPWLLKIFSLGRFELWHDGAPVDLAGKKKPLQLLKALLALGGSAVSQERLIDLVWPEAEGDDGRNSFKTTLSRLRRVLPGDALDLQEGALTLRRDLVWCDADAFDHSAGRALELFALARQEAEEGIRDPDALAPVLTAGERALQLYRGVFLPGENDPAAIALRERLRARHLRLLRSVAERQERQGRWHHASELYLRGAEVDPLQEEIYQRLIFCYLQLGRHLAALAVYERCRAELFSGLGVTPSPTTEGLHAKIRQACS